MKGRIRRRFQVVLISSVFLLCFNHKKKNSSLSIILSNSHDHDETRQRHEIIIMNKKKILRVPSLQRQQQQVNEVVKDKQKKDTKKTCGTKDISLSRKQNMQNIAHKSLVTTTTNTQESNIFVLDPEEVNNNDNSNNNNRQYIFDTYFHIIHDGTEGYVTDEQVASTIAVLNRGFAGQEYASCGGIIDVDDDDDDDDYNRCDDQYQNNNGSFLHHFIVTVLSIQKKNNNNNNKERKLFNTMEFEYGSTKPGTGVDTRISFVLKGITRTYNTEWFHNIDTLEDEYKPYLHQGDCTTLNIYSGNSAYLGFAHYPDECAADDENNKMIYDGVIIDYTTLEGGSNMHHSEGDNLTHEVGHWLGLLHTFEGNTCDEPNTTGADTSSSFSLGDSIQDTATQLHGTEGCPHMRDSCPQSEGLDPIYNFMDYSHDCCMDSFTQHQKDFMRAMIQAYRT